MARIVCLILVLCFAIPCLSTDYIVGDSSGWSLGADYSTWTPAGTTLSVGDNLVFNYGSGHTVDEVSASDYSSCSLGNSLTSDNSGATIIPLKTAGKHYFICGVIGHCSSGMKLAVTVSAGGATTTITPTTTTSVISPPSGTTTTPPTMTPSVIFPPSGTTTTTSPLTTITTPSTTAFGSSSSGTLSPFLAVMISWVVLFKSILF